MFLELAHIGDHVYIYLAPILSLLQVEVELMSKQTAFDDKYESVKLLLENVDRRHVRNALKFYFADLNLSTSPLLLNKQHEFST